VIATRRFDLFCGSSLVDLQSRWPSSGPPAVGHYCQGSRQGSRGSTGILGRLEVEERLLQGREILIMSKSFLLDEA
jgi:hypothetical protein